MALLLLLGIPVYVLNRDRGVSYMFLLFVALVVIFDFVIRRTRWGRSVLAIGGNVEAARRAGINVKRVYVTVFVFCSTLAALGGLLAAGRLASANQSSGGADTNLNAIAAAVIGGTSLFGGRGSAYSALLGILVIQSISNGLSLVNLGLAGALHDHRRRAAARGHRRLPEPSQPRRPRPRLTALTPRRQEGYAGWSPPGIPLLSLLCRAGGQRVAA